MGLRTQPSHLASSSSLCHAAILFACKSHRSLIYYRVQLLGGGGIGLGRRRIQSWDECSRNVLPHSVSSYLTNALFISCPIKLEHQFL
ncbi:hypothetical protein XELAEV_18038416mg [Xenopus laevis]|uniref:Uncharacterized protein n=1 Tax=Xenopus laevis TaxID=8355 RepID=A0A974C601_XENLA|nr:hypothetical protein XELAEV_18038416mg [Xenopus laevis]